MFQFLIGRLVILKTTTVFVACQALYGLIFIRKEKKTMKRYYVYNFLIGDPVVVDTKEKTLAFYGRNIYGQIYNLDSPDITKITPQRVSGLTKRLNNGNYSYKNSYAIDTYIYYHIMTSQQKDKCNRSAYNPIPNEFITSGNNLKKVLEEMCLWAFYYDKPIKNDDQTKNYYKKYLDKIGA
jgi:hypothetical protein